MSKQIISIPEEAVGDRIDRYIARMFPQLTFMSISKLLRVGDIRINQKKVTGSYRLQEGDELRLPPATVLSAYERAVKPTQAYLYSTEQLEAFETWILFEDKDILVLNKPDGLAVQGGTGTFVHVDGLLKAYGKIRKENYKLVHRLDRDTSGVLMVAKSAKVAEFFHQQFSGRQLKKEYLALTCGVPNPMSGTIDAAMMKMSGAMGERMEVTMDGDEAITDYEVVDSTPEQFALVKLKPHTGRTHQLRVHMAYIDCPILGDPKYNHTTIGHISHQLSVEIPDRLYLHAHRLAVVLSNGARKEFVAPLPPEWQATLKILNFSIK
jgi:23S rRNA pseudouridine955/2504/2580 synthase